MEEEEEEKKTLKDEEANDTWGHVKTSVSTFAATALTRVTNSLELHLCDIIRLE